MADEELEARLQSHARAFDGLMSLIPAKNYYGQDNSDQWQRKKQTKEQKKAARKEKLKPENQKSVKDVMDENERKRKREIEQEADDEAVDLDNPLLEKPREGMKPPKKQKVANDAEAPDTTKASNIQGDENTDDNRKKTKAEKRKEKRKLKSEKATRKHEKVEAKKAQKQEEQLAEVSGATQNQADVNEDEFDHADADMEAINLDGITEDTGHDSRSSVTPTPVPETPQSPGPHSASSSTSSIIPPFTADPSEKPQPTKPSDTRVSNLSTATTTSQSQTDQASNTSRDESSTGISKSKKLPSGSEINTELLRARLKTRIDALRAARKADGPEGNPARNRQELLEQRRRKEEERRQRKKEMRKKQREAEAEQAAAAAAAATTQAAQLQAQRHVGETKGKGKEPEPNFSYGNIHFNDGQALDPSLTTLLPAPKPKGPQDAKTALAAAQHKQSRGAGLDPAKRADIEDKDRWLHARQRVHGEQGRRATTSADDVGVLRKAVKRKEKAKGKSAREWRAREDGVRQGQAARQRRREENLRKRKEAKGVGKGAKKNKGVKTKKGGKRPGFEGRFRT